jgi:hypothetical protein
MTMTTESFVGELHQGSLDACFGRAVAAELEQRYPVHAGKNVAADLNCTAKAAENLLAGHLSARTLTRLVKAYGLGLLISAAARVTGEGLEDFIEKQAAEAELAEDRARERKRAYHDLQSSLRSARGRDSLGGGLVP